MIINSFDKGTGNIYNGLDFRENQKINSLSQKNLKEHQKSYFLKK